MIRYLICADRKNRMDILNEYPSLEEALSRLKYHMKKEKCRIRIIPVPQITIGCRIYNRDGNYYGTVTNETSTLWGITKEDKMDGIPNPYGKVRIDKWIIERGLIVLNGTEVLKIEDMFDITAHVDSKAEKLYQDLQYINSEQIGFF